MSYPKKLIGKGRYMERHDHNSREVTAVLRCPVCERQSPAYMEYCHACKGYGKHDCGRQYTVDTERPDLTVAERNRKQYNGEEIHTRVCRPCGVRPDVPVPVEVEAKQKWQAGDIVIRDKGNFGWMLREVQPDGRLLKLASEDVNIFDSVMSLVTLEKCDGTYRLATKAEIEKHRVAIKRHAKYYKPEPPEGVPLESTHVNYLAFWLRNGELKVKTGKYYLPTAYQHRADIVLERQNAVVGGRVGWKTIKNCFSPLKPTSYYHTTSDVVASIDKELRRHYESV